MITAETLDQIRIQTDLVVASRIFEEDEHEIRTRIARETGGQEAPHAGWVEEIEKARTELRQLICGPLRSLLPTDKPMTDELWKMSIGLCLTVIHSGDGDLAKLAISLVTVLLVQIFKTGITAFCAAPN